MTRPDMDQYREKLLTLGARINLEVSRLADEAFQQTGGEAAGSLSNAPQHLADLGTVDFDHQMTVTLLENEQQTREQILGALERIENGTYGFCQSCQQEIGKARLEAIPYTAYCVKCAEAEQTAPGGRATTGANIGPGFGSFNSETSRDRPRPERRRSRTSNPEIAMRNLDRATRDETEDSHATGTPGGGSAVGGLGGTNIDDGAPDNAPLEDAAGSGNFDVDLAETEDDGASYSGSTEGAVGEMPAGIRATGGKASSRIPPRRKRRPSGA